MYIFLLIIGIVLPPPPPPPSMQPYTPPPSPLFPPSQVCEIMCIASKNNTQLINSCCTLPLLNGDSYAGTVGAVGDDARVFSDNLNFAWNDLIELSSTFISVAQSVQIPFTKSDKYTFRVTVSDTYGPGIVLSAQALPFINASSLEGIAVLLEEIYVSDIKFNDPRAYNISIRLVPFLAEPGIYTADASVFIEEMINDGLSGKYTVIRITSVINPCIQNTCTETVGYSLSEIVIIEKGSDDVNIGAIIGGILGGVAALVIIIYAYYYYRYN